MAINKKLIHFNTFENFNSKKLSANVENTQYTLGVDGEVQTGSPEILYQSICWIKDTKQQWTHGQLYNGGSTEANVQAVDTSEILDDVSGGSSSGSGAYSEVSHGTADTTFILTPNTFHIWDEVSTLTLTLGAETSGVANEYTFQFTSGSEPTTLSLPDDIKWTGGEAPTIEAGKIYQISILKGLGSVLEWDNVVVINFFINGIEYQAEEGMTWREWVNTNYNTLGYYYDSYSNTLKIGSAHIVNISVDDLIINDASYTLYDPT